MYRKGVSALIKNAKNEFLLVNLESFSTEYFAVPGGGVEGKESLEEAIYREMEEELNIRKEDVTNVGESPLPLRFQFKTQKLYRDGRAYTGSERYFFGFQYVGETSLIKVQAGEVRSYEWVNIDQLHRYLLFEHQCEDTLEKIVEIFGKEMTQK